MVEVLSAPGSASASDVLRAVAAHGLESVEVRAYRATADGWPGLVARLERSRLTGLAVAAAQGGALVLGDEQRSSLVKAHEAALANCLQLDRFLLRVLEIFDAHDVDAVVLKGPAVARSLYRSPEVRLYGDIDLLVPSASWDAAVAAIDDLGWLRLYGEPRPGWARRFGKGTVVHSDDGWELDLHRTFVRGPYGLAVDLDAVHADRDRVAVADRDVPVLAPTTSFLHACFNAVLADSPPRLVAVRDVAQHLEVGRVDLDAARVLARSWRAEAVVARAVLLAHELLGSTSALDEWARSVRRTQWDRVALVAYRDTRHNTARESLVALLAVRGLRAKVAYTWPLLHPQRSYTEGRFATRRARFASAARAVVRRR